MQSEQSPEGTGEPLATSQRRPFQFTLRTLFLLTFVVALFCSAAATFDGIMLFFAVSVVVWGVVGAIYWKIQAAPIAVFAHVFGPVFGIIACVVSVYRNSAWEGAWETLIGAGCIAGILVSISIALAAKRRTKAP